MANAAIVPAGTDGHGGVDVYASNATDLVIDINGYYAAPGDLNGNTGLGSGALASNTTGHDNTAEGTSALAANTTGYQNTAAGSGVLAANTTGYNNTATGADALKANTTGFNNTAMGSATLYANTIGIENTAVGVNALNDNTSGNNNTAVGAAALQANTTGINNAAVGFAALQVNTIGIDNAAVGVDALNANTTGNYNSAFGTSAMYANTTGVNNTGAGNNALNSNTTGNNNTATGNHALNFNTTGGSNTAVGAGALQNNLTGSNDIAIGYNSALNVSTGSNNIHIASQGVAGDNAVIRIGTPGTQTAFFAAGINGVTTGNSNAIAVVVDSNGQLGTVSSSRRFKEDIHDMGDASSGLLRLRPVTFRYRQPFADRSKPVQFGLIAEEVEKVYPELVAYSADGQIESVKYQVLDSMLLNEVQKQAETNRQQGEEIRLLKERLAAVEALLLKASSVERQ